VQYIITEDLYHQWWCWLGETKPETFREKETHGYALLENVATFLILLSRYLFSTKKWCQVEIGPMVEDKSSNTTLQQVAFTDFTPLSYYYKHITCASFHLPPSSSACELDHRRILTWPGSACDMWKWNPSSSTMLQILVYIQALVLNAKPYFNEPGHAAYANTPGGEKQSLLYNEETFLLSCRTMLYSLRNPPNVLRCLLPYHIFPC
jgi:ubiquitin-conjugating enzyme E2 O